MRPKLVKPVVRYLTFAGLIFVFAFGPGTSLLIAGGPPPAESVATDQTIAQAVVTHAHPPQDFHPLSASGAELERYGFPPRPDAVRARTPYAHWKKIVSVPRVANPTLQQTTIYNGPIRNMSIVRALKNGIVSATSQNWSGYAITGAIGTFVENNAYVFSQWVVPRAQQAFGVCSGFWDYSSQWDGFDGIASSDVLQAGTEADAYCSGSTPIPFYSAWIEWFPFPETRVSIPAVRPGDLMGSEVWYTTAPPFGHAYLVNYTLQQAGAYSFNPPSGAAFLGNSAEWIEERPVIGTTLTDLTNYVADQFNVAYAYNTGSYFLPRTSPAGTTTLAISMACPAWTPGSSCPSTTTISAPYLYGPWSLWFYDFPPAF